MTIYIHKCQCFHEKLAGNWVDPITGTNLYWWKITMRISLNWSNFHYVSWDVIKISKCLLTGDQTVFLLQIDIGEYHKESLTHSLPYSQIYVIESHSGPLNLPLAQSRHYRFADCSRQVGKFLQSILHFNVNAGSYDSLQGRLSFWCPYATRHYHSQGKHGIADYHRMENKKSFEM
jgi:hypothetical protein